MTNTRANRARPPCVEIRSLWTRWSALRSAVLPLMCCAMLTAGCSRPTGDFGRAQPSVIHDTLMPEAGKLAARVRGEPVSEFILTDDEKLLRDLGWGLIRPPWARDWIGGTKVELSRTRLLPEKDGKVPVTLYSVFLGSERFNSSEARFDRIAADARGDAKLVPPFCEVATRVEAADRERLAAVSRRDILTQDTFEGPMPECGKTGPTPAGWHRRCVSAFKPIRRRQTISRSRHHPVHVSGTQTGRSRNWKGWCGWRKAAARRRTASIHLKI
ncbi:hypothetical protein V6L77_19120 [Pannonibacter sp. Pt2-lr]